MCTKRTRTLWFRTSTVKTWKSCRSNVLWTSNVWKTFSVASVQQPQSSCTASNICHFCLQRADEEFASKSKERVLRWLKRRISIITCGSNMPVDAPFDIELERNGEDSGKCWTRVASTLIFCRTILCTASERFPMQSMQPSYSLVLGWHTFDRHYFPLAGFTWAKTMHHAASIN